MLSWPIYYSQNYAGILGSALTSTKLAPKTLGKRGERERERERERCYMHVCIYHYPLKNVFTMHL